MTNRTMRLVLNGKKAGLPAVRKAVNTVRDQGHTVDVSVTWEAGDAARFVVEALDAGVDVIVAGGGDGTVNEVMTGLVTASDAPSTPMAVVPLGSANDFATGCGVPIGDPTAALELAATGDSIAIDVAQINDRFFLNTAIAGFGAEVTFNTSERLKKAIGGGAYGLTGFLTALKKTAYGCNVVTADRSWDERMLFAAVCNGRQAGGMQLAPRASLNDGLLDFMSVEDFQIGNVKAVVQELQSQEFGEFVHYGQADWIEVEAEREIPITPDGEEMTGMRFRIDILKQRLPFILPGEAPVTR